MKVIIAGTRTFDSYNLLKGLCDYVLSNKSKTENIEIVLGGAKGADKLGGEICKRK